MYKFLAMFLNLKNNEFLKVKKNEFKNDGSKKLIQDDLEIETPRRIFKCWDILSMVFIGIIFFAFACWVMIWFYLNCKLQYFTAKIEEWKCTYGFVQRLLYKPMGPAYLFKTKNKNLLLESSIRFQVREILKRKMRQCPMMCTLKV